MKEQGAFRLLCAVAFAGVTAADLAPLLMDRAQSLSACLQAAGVPTDAQGSSGWNTETTPFNSRLPYTPAAVVIPTNVTHVQSAVSCAAQAGVKVSAKGGGHSYASFGLGGENGHLIISFSEMYKVTLDKSTNISEVQAGARLGHVFETLYNAGGRAISHGTCPGVGVAGHALHGGFGFSSHTHGLALDWLVGATVVLANATVVNCSASQNADLFWALRGAGSSYGIVTSFFFNTFAAPVQTTPFTLNVNWQNGNDMAAGWTAYQNFVQNKMPPELNMRLFLSNWLNGFEGLYHGNATALQAALQPLLSALNLAMPSVNTTDWVGGFTAYANGQTIDVTDNSDSAVSVALFLSLSLFTPSTLPIASVLHDLHPCVNGSPVAD
jgi:FAD/FMN-containing dehydrogenase